jgi:hypothetical protein
MYLRSMALKHTLFNLGAPFTPRSMRVQVNWLHLFYFGGPVDIVLDE